MDHAKLRRIARRQLGLFTRAQARACGFSARQIRWRLDGDEWRPVLGTVLAPIDLRLTALVMDRAAPLAVAGGVLAGPSAARTWGIGVPDNRIYLAVARNHHPSVRGIQYLRTDLTRRDIYGWEGAGVTGRQRTVGDCLRILPEGAARDLLDRALQRAWITLPELVSYVRQSVGRKGVRKVQAMMREAAQGSRSAAERLAVVLLTAAKIVGWRVNVPITAGGELIGIGDIVFQAERLVLELDGWAFHVTPEQFQRDRARQNRLVAAGWTVLRFTWRDLTERPEYVVATIEAMLATLRTR
jgi:very-short-patch-repair endonuclease